MSRVAPPISRRQAVKTVGAALAAAPLAHVFACGSTPGGESSGMGGGTSGTGSAGGEGVTKVPHCHLAPELTHAPTYRDIGLLRADLREGAEGAALVLTLRVLDARTCEPLAGAAVDVWNASPRGHYSSCKAPLTPADTYLRGVQIADAEGVVVMTTLYPGWYKDRAPHVHVKVHVGGAVSGDHYADGTAGHICYVGQVWFPQEYNDELHGTGAYASNTIPYITNEHDHVLGSMKGEGPIFLVTKDAPGRYRAAITLAVDPTSTPSTGAADAGPRDAAPD
jgi:protocatechuate 3,4-dioxygenase beta subunit